ncbi:MAG: DUF2207 domain-containing protein [Proteobacteria bacterium]|nr:DUF2207 domain-containing protein [Pseudomonadota bacterium]MBU1649937.1 DUF2207 domain-containing protein [Pseudomonadota bacterium]MBU1986222.1 DUF2207 domain-containing protein [Pseudomonadota bacterium]
MEVQARLDRDGRLHVRELQTMVFSGDWNGGERKFYVGAGQHLQVNCVLRVDVLNDREVELARGSLTQVNHWNFHTGSTIRWRSRQPSDPLFQNTALTYIIEYTLSGIIIPDNHGGYRLNHDFAFTERPGPIQHFSLDLELDPVWQTEGDRPLHLTQDNIQPGKGVVLQIRLTHSEGNPAAIYRPPKPPAPIPVRHTPSFSRLLLFSTVLLFFLWRFAVFFRYEKKAERFHTLVPPEDVDQQWLDQHLFHLLPEVVGATWDKRTSGYEVAAVLARLVLEGKMESWLEPKKISIFHYELFLPWLPPVLHLRLLQPREQFSSYEHTLIEGLFINGEATDTEAIRDYYQGKNSSFDPAGKLREPLEKKVSELTAALKNPLELIWIPTLLLGLCGFFLLLFNAVLHQDEFGLQMIYVATAFFLYIIGLIGAINYRDASIRLPGRMLFFVGIVVLIETGYASLLYADASLLLLLGGSCLVLAMMNNILNIAKSRDSIEGIRLRQHLASAREYFKAELQKEKPELEDAWFPYLLAFGLGKHMDAWFGKYGNSIHTFSSGNTSHSSSGFSGGGGIFGGAGASGSWATAVNSMATSASSSSSGGSSGGSGGGGGGGW